MECISVFDMLKIGVGPSSSHTLGPWRAAERWLLELKHLNIFNQVDAVTVDLFGSLSLTGKGHATDIATVLGLCGENPETIPINIINNLIDDLKTTHRFLLGGTNAIGFSMDKHIVFNKTFLDFHSNGISFKAFKSGTEINQSTFFSVGGGFVVKEGEKSDNNLLKNKFPFTIDSANQLLNYCKSEKKSISEISSAQILVCHQIRISHFFLNAEYQQLDETKY